MNIPLEVNHNSILLDFSKVQRCKLYWVNQYGQAADSKPDFATYYKERVATDDRPPAHERLVPAETYEEYLKRNRVLDVWSARVCFQLTANQSAYYAGSMAVKLAGAYRQYLFAKSKRRSKTTNTPNTKWKPKTQQQDLL